MRERAPLLLLLGSACTFLASLYLPWVTAPSSSCGTGCMRSAYTTDAWSSGIGDGAALVGLGLATLAAAALVRPAWIRRLPLALCGLGLGYSMLALWATAGAHRIVISAGPGSNLHLHWAYGMWLGSASAGLVVCAVAAIAGRGLARRPSASMLVTALLGLGLLTSFLLPWYRFDEAGRAFYTVPGIMYSSAALAVLAVFVAAASETRRLGAAAAAALLTGAAFSASSPAAPRAYGAWLALGFALALFAYALFAARGTLGRPAATAGAWAVAGAAALFVVSLFMRWEMICAPSSNGFAPGIGRCISANGWSVPNSTAAILALLVVAAAPLLSHWRISSAELAAGTGLLVATTGFEIGAFPVAASYGYGAFVGFAAVGAFLLLVLGRRRLPQLDGRLGARLVPVTAAALVLLEALVPSWSVLPSTWRGEAGVLTGWLTVAGLLLSLHLLGAWLPLRGRAAPGAGTLMLVPSLLLALAIFGICRDRYLGLTWGGGILLALCLLLLALGWIEESGGGLERLRLPELLRLDRLPDAEG